MYQAFRFVSCLFQKLVIFAEVIEVQKVWEYSAIENKLSTRILVAIQLVGLCSIRCVISF